MFSSVAGHTLKCVRYDVSSQSVSIHLPITRILSGKHLHQFCYAPNFKEVKGHVAFGLYVRPSITLFYACHILRTMHAGVLKFNIWIPHGNDQNLFGNVIENGPNFICCHPQPSTWPLGQSHNLKIFVQKLVLYQIFYNANFLQSLQWILFIFSSPVLKYR